MKKFLIILIAAVSICSCRRDFDETIFGESPDQRLTKTLDSLQARLVGQQVWIGLLTTGDGTKATFFFRFNDSNRVMMASEAVTDGELVKVSSYRLKALQQPALIFDTYSYLHIFANPAGSVNGGTNGVGLQSDFEFAYDPSADNTDSIVLTGRMHNSRLVLIPTAPEDGNVFTTNGLQDSFVFDSLSTRYLNYFKRFTLGGNTYELVVNRRKKAIKLAWMEGGTYKEATSYYVNTPSGNLELLHPVTAIGQRISSFKGMQWDNAAVLLSFTINGERVTPVGFTRPLQAELAAPRRWWERSKSSYWRSAKGFRVNGVDDAYRISSQPAFNHVMYAGEWARPASGPRDVFGYVRDNAQAYFAPAVISPPEFTNDGRIVFRRVAVAGGDPGSYNYYGTLPGQVGVNATIASLIKLENAQGYYLVQIIDTYDMVDAVNATSWINWE